MRDGWDDLAEAIARQASKDLARKDGRSKATARAYLEESLATAGLADRIDELEGLQR